MDIVCKGVWLKPAHNILPTFQNITSNNENIGIPKGKIITRRNDPDRLREVLGVLDRRRLLLSQLSPTPPHICNTNYQE